MMTRRSFASSLAAAAAPADRPSFVVMQAGDLGYGDLACYGHPTIRTPNLDQMARDGARFTQFYAAAGSSSSREALLTGRLPVRSASPASEVTIASALTTAGYSTASVGKWDMGQDPDKAVAGTGADLSRLTARHTEEGIRFLRECARNKRPFFLYLAHRMPHHPLYASGAFRGQSPRGLYGDVVEELDWSAGEIRRTLREQGLDRSTLVVFTSDNGPWLAKNEEGGSAGPLREGKGSPWEGGFRVPGIIAWSGVIAAFQTVAAPASTMDLLPTFLRLAGVRLPRTALDGTDLTPVLLNGEERRDFRLFYYLGTRLRALRAGPWKLVLPEPPGEKPELYHLEQDPGERYDHAGDQPRVVARMEGLVKQHLERVKAALPAG